MIEIIKSGVAKDPRPEAIKAKDYLHDKLYGGLPVTWVEKKDWKLPSERLQNGSSSCVAQSTATALEVLLKGIMSAGTYRLRKNYPGFGMWLADMGDLDKNKGRVFELLCPSQDMSEEEMNKIVLPKFLNVKVKEYRTFGQLDIETIAQAIQAYGNCVLTFGSNSSEWKETPKYNGGKITFYHAICGTDYGLKNGKKVIACRDSAGSSRVRYITEDFLAKRNTGAMYYTSAVVTTVPNTWEATLDFVIRLLKGLK